MPKPDPALLDASRYPFHCEIHPRFGDLDLNQHLNNVALAGILEEGRVHFHRVSKYEDAVAGITSMAASFAVDYLGQAHYPEPLVIHTAAIGIGRTSHTLGQVALQQGRLIAYAQTVLVCVHDHQPVANSPLFIEAVRPWMLRP
jgi:acyl-CoA thioester hydrolase